MTAWRSLFSLLIFPGALFALPAGWFMLWLQRKINARLQGRIGPPFFQPFWDFVKLLAKEPVPRPPLQGFLMIALPLVAVASTLGAIAMLPVFPTADASSGDLVLLVSLIEVGPLCAVLGGFVSRSLYGGIGATREALLTLAYNVPFLTALFALAVSAGSFSLAGVALEATWLVRVLALVALVACLPVKLHLNPFSAASAEQEIYAGSTTEYDGPRLALWELAHALEWVALTGLVASLAFPVVDASWPVRTLVFLAVSLALVVGLSVTAAATARLKLAQTMRWFLLWGSGISVLALVVALVRL